MTRTLKPSRVPHTELTKAQSLLSPILNPVQTRSAFDGVKTRIHHKPMRFARYSAIDCTGISTYLLTAPTVTGFWPSYKWLS